jgi:hypothetical protein
VVAATFAANTLASNIERVSTNLEKGNSTSTHEHFCNTKNDDAVLIYLRGELWLAASLKHKSSSREAIDVGVSQSKANETKSKLGMDDDD